MAVHSKPLQIPRWADNPPNRDIAIVPPDEEKKDKGWEFGEKPAFSYFNWLNNLTGDWLKWINERFDDGSTKDELKIMDPGSGVRVALASGAESKLHVSGGTIRGDRDKNVAKKQSLELRRYVGSDFDGTALTVDIGMDQGLVNLVAGAEINADGKGYSYLGLRGASRILLNDGEIRFSIGAVPNSTKGQNVDWVTPLTIYPIKDENQNNKVIDGNVGIGTPTPGAKLDVAGNIRIATEIEPNTGPLNQIGKGSPKDPPELALPGIEFSDDLFVANDLGVGDSLRVRNRFGVYAENENSFIMGKLGIGTDDVKNRLQLGEGNIAIADNQHRAGKIRLWQEDNNDDAFVSHGIGTDAWHNVYGPGSSYASSIGHIFYSGSDGRGGRELIAQIGFGGERKPADRQNSYFAGDTHFARNIDIDGHFLFRTTENDTAEINNSTFFTNESNFVKNNVKLSLKTQKDNSPFPTPPAEYEFIIGHINQPKGPPGTIVKPSFQKKFSINHNGELYCAGSKAGYVVDHFVNRVGDTLEQGDVVIISKYQSSHYSGTDNNIPLPEVDVTSNTYDSRVCGIVASVVTESELPYVELEQTLQPELKENIKKKPGNVQSDLNPLRQFAATAIEDLDKTKVQDRQMGKMVTLGAFAHCKVDADIAPIEVGDLLTTSTTKGHAQKVLEREKAAGAIIGKALGSLNKGKGKIPVLVLLH